MPNILAHMTIAHELGGSLDPDLLLASTMPDFIGMYHDYFGVRIDPVSLSGSPAMAEGMRLHHRTDGTYDHLPKVTELKLYVREDLRATAPKLGLGALRVCADVGTDILVDAGIMASIPTTAAFDAVKNALAINKTEVQSHTEAQFVEMIEEFFVSNRPQRYKEPEAVATIIYGRLVARNSKYLVMSEADIDPVAEVLARHKGKVYSSARTVIRETVELISAQNKQSMPSPKAEG